MKVFVKVLVVLLLVTGCLVGGYLGRPYLQKMLGEPEDATTAPRETRNGPLTVTALGRLEPGSEIVDVSAPAGSRIKRLGEKVKEGAFIEEGEPLAYLDNYEELKAAKELAETKHKEAQDRLVAETNLNNALIAAAKLKIRHAEEVLPKQIKAQEAEVRRIVAELEKCNLDLKRSQKLLDDGAIPQSQHDTVALAHRQCVEHLEQSQATLTQLKANQEIQKLTAEADLKSAEAALVRAELSTLVRSLGSAVKLAQEQLDRAVITAPISGEILKVLTRAGESVGQEPIVKMGDTRSMYVIAKVYETDVRLVKPGMKATVTSQAFPGTKLEGTVERIGSLIYKSDVFYVDPTKDADNRIIEVRIRLKDSKIASGYNYMEVDVTIHRMDPEPHNL